MSQIHPTTHAIARGLIGIELPREDRLAFIADLARELAERHGLPDRHALFQAAVDGWDLGIRSLGWSRAEITASRRYEDTDLRLIVTALVDIRLRTGWTFPWLLQSEGPSMLVTRDVYPNGIASSFSDARHAAEREAAKHSKF